MELLTVVKNIIKNAKNSKRQIKLSKLASKQGLNPEIISGINYCQEVQFFTGLDMNNEMIKVGNSCMTQKNYPYYFWAYADKKIKLAILKNSRCLINATEKTFYKLYGENCGDLKKALSCYGLKQDINAFESVNIPNDILVKEFYTFKTEYKRIKNYKVVLFENKKGHYSHCSIKSICTMTRNQFTRPDYYKGTIGYDYDYSFQNVSPEIIKTIKESFCNKGYKAGNRLNFDSKNNMYFTIQKQNYYKSNYYKYDNIIGKIFKVKNHKDLKAFVLDIELETIRTTTKIEVDNILCDYPYNDSTSKFETMGTLGDVVISKDTGEGYKRVLEF